MKIGIRKVSSEAKVDDIKELGEHMDALSKYIFNVYYLFFSFNSIYNLI